MALQMLLHIAICHEEEHCLHTVDNVTDIMVMIIFRVAELYFMQKVRQVFQRQVVCLKEVKALEYFESEELKASIHTAGFVLKDIEADFVHVARRLLVDCLLVEYI